MAGQYFTTTKQLNVRTILDALFWRMQRKGYKTPDRQEAGRLAASLCRESGLWTGNWARVN